MSSRRRFAPVCFSLALPLMLAALPACGGDDDESGPDAGADGGGGGDGAGDDGGDGGPDGGASACPLPESLGAFDPLADLDAREGPQDDDPADRWLGVAGIADGERPPAPVEYLVVELWDGFGAFEGGQLAAGEYSIAGPDATAFSCGVCVHLLANATLVDGQFQREKEYVATSGTVTIDSVGTRSGNEITGNYAGSATGLTFVEVDPESGDGAPLDGGCQTTIESVSWDAPIN